MRLLTCKFTLLMCLALTVATPPVSAGNSTTPSLSAPVAARYYSYVPPGVDQPANVALFQDEVPWGNQVDETILIDYGIAFTVFGSDDMGFVDLSPFDKVILCNQQRAAFVNAVLASKDWFNAYVSNGGCLLLGLAYRFGDIPVNTDLIAGFGLAIEAPNESVSIELPGHDVINFPHSPGDYELDGWSDSSHGDLLMPGAAMGIVSNNDSSGMALAECSWGNGYVIATTQPYQWDYADPLFAENLILYMPCGAIPVEPSSWGSIKSAYRSE